MFKQVKTARALMEDTKYKHDEFNWIQIIMFIIFLLIIVGIWFYSQKANRLVKKNIKNNNPIIQDLQAEKQLEEGIEKYGNINE